MAIPHVGKRKLNVPPIPLTLAALICGIPTLPMKAKGGLLGTIVGIIDLVIGVALIASFASV